MGDRTAFRDALELEKLRRRIIALENRLMMVKIRGEIEPVWKFPPRAKLYRLDQDKLTPGPYPYTVVPQTDMGGETGDYGDPIDGVQIPNVAGSPRIVAPSPLYGNTRGDNIYGNLKQNARGTPQFVPAPLLATQTQQTDIVATALSWSGENDSLGMSDVCSFPDGTGGDPAMTANSAVATVGQKAIPPTGPTSDPSTEVYRGGLSFRTDAVPGGKISKAQLLLTVSGITNDDPSLNTIFDFLVWEQPSFGDSVDPTDFRTDIDVERTWHNALTNSYVAEPDYGLGWGRRPVRVASITMGELIAMGMGDHAVAISLDIMRIDAGLWAARDSWTQILVLTGSCVPAGAFGDPIVEESVDFIWSGNGDDAKKPALRLWTEDLV